MDTVSMLNTMSFYCQPILPLVYDESMSYYETLCKVVGQLNNTGETVNKLNEGLTNEIADRQAGDAALDERLKQIEALNDRIHFLVFDGANPSGAMPTRSELYNWVRNGDAIYTLFSTNESGRGQVYAASCSYNAGNWGSEASNDFNIIVPLETKYDGANDYAVMQKVAKLTIPSISQPSLNASWGLQIIEVNIPSTSAEGVVNVIAVVSDSGSVNCSITPSEFLQLYNMTRGGKNLCVAVNAKLAYDGLARSSSIATVDTTNRIVRIAFERDSGTAIMNGVNQLTKTLDYIIGDAKTGVWVHETIDSKIFDFNRYEGFQFTRGAGNVITTDADSTPSAVYAYYNGQSGKLYQNLPTRLIDEVDGAEYWNGVFDSYSDGHITFTFTTANYATIGEKMVVRVIELSSTKAGSVWTGGEKWSYAAKEFEVPYSPTAFVLDVWQTSDTPTIANGFVTYQGGSNLDFDDILPLVENNQEFVATLHKGTSDKGIEWSGLAYSTMLVNGGVGRIVFATLEGVTLANGIPSMDGIVVFEKDSDGAKKVEITFSSALPAPNPDGSDNGKVPTVNGTTWEMKTPSGGGSANAVLYTPQTLTDEQKKQVRDNVEVLSRNSAHYMYIDNNHSNDIYSLATSGPIGFVTGTASAGMRVPVTLFFGAVSMGRVEVLAIDFKGDMYQSILYLSSEVEPKWTKIGQLRLNDDGVLPQQTMASAPTSDMQIATKQYVDDNKGSANAVQYIAQELTAPQKLQARKNIDALGSVAPNIQNYMVITPPGQDAGIGVSLSAAGTGGDFTLDISDANEGQPTKLTGVKTPTDEETHAAANVEYVKNKVAGATGGAVDEVMSNTSTNAVQNKVIKKYVDEYRNQMINGKLFGATMIGADVSKPNLGVQIEVEAADSDAAINLLNLYGGEGTKLTGIATPGFADNDSAATVAFMLHNSFVIVDTEEVKSYDYQGILEEINRRTCNIWLDVNQQKIRLNSYKVTGSGAYQLIFIGSSDGSAVNVHSVTVSASAAEYAITTK